MTMPLKQRVLISGAGAIAPLAISFLTVDIGLLDDLQAGTVVGYGLRVLVLFALGAVVGLLNKSVHDPRILFQLGITAPALIGGMIVSQQPAAKPDRQTDAPQAAAPMATPEPQTALVIAPHPTPTIQPVSTPQPTPTPQPTAVAYAPRAPETTSRRLTTPMAYMMRREAGPQSMATPRDTQPAMRAPRYSIFGNTTYHDLFSGGETPNAGDKPQPPISSYWTGQPPDYDPFDAYKEESLMTWADGGGWTSYSPDTTPSMLLSYPTDQPMTATTVADDHRSTEQICLVTAHVGPEPTAEPEPTPVFRPHPAAAAERDDSSFARQMIRGFTGGRR